MKSLDTVALKQFLKKAGDKLKGQWLLVGGTLLPALGIDHRSTVDIDLVGLGETERASSMDLMDIAEGMGLSVESINQAAAYFVDKVGYTVDDLIPMVKSKSAIIYRPNFELYASLKMNRMTESDLSDCLEYLKFCLKKNETINFTKVKKRAQLASKGANADRKARIKALLKACESPK